MVLTGVQLLILAVIAGCASAPEHRLPETRHEAAADTVRYPLADDVASPEGIVAAAYDAITRRPREPFNWDRELSLFLPNARLIPNTEVTGGEFRVLTPAEYRAWVDNWYAQNAPIDAPDDKGFAEEEIHSIVERYGDVAHVMSTYQKRFWSDDQILGRGVNSFQLVFHDGRWWIAGIVWDEENGGGPIPSRYLP